jgi:hypothetical protein
LTSFKDIILKQITYFMLSSASKMIIQDSRQMDSKDESITNVIQI